MQLAPLRSLRSLRDVKFHRLVLALQLHLRPRCCQPPTRGIQLRKPQEYGFTNQSRAYSVTAFSPDAVTDVPSSPPVLDKVEDFSAQSRPQASSLGLLRSLTQDNELFGRWRALLSNSPRLAVETDFDRKGLARSWEGPLLADKVEHRGDLALWSCLLDYQIRINGDLGAFKVWKGLWGRKALLDIENPLAPVFWQTILEAAVRLDDRKFLQSVYLYSEWMYGMYQVKWPRLYSTIMTHLLRTRQHYQALQWHLRLMPTFDPGPEEFTEILKQFASETELYRPFTLQSLYILNPNRQLYDKLVPHLYARGESALAITWRDVMIQHDDAPISPVSVRPFLRYLQGYYPKRLLHPREAAAIGLDSSFAEEEEETPEVSREFINRVHGGTFGISVKNYNDGLGAKWFASSWVSLDTAISTIAALGIEKIGPLSLQSIALREQTLEGVSKRIGQLQSRGITVVDSNYLRIVLHFVKIKDEELLFDLLRSDFHPDVFDNPHLLAQLLESTAASDNWRAYRLLLAARIVIMQRTTRETANAVLRACFLSRDRHGLFKALDDMLAMRIGIDYDQVNLIFQSLLDEVPDRKYKFNVNVHSPQIVVFYLHICTRLVSMEVPVPIACWKLLIESLGKQGMLDAMEKLCLDLVSLFTSSRSSRPGFIPVHLDDIPEPMKQPLIGVENLLGVYVPDDLPTSIALHPLRQIFDTKMLKALIRWTFRASFGQTGRMRPTPLVEPRKRISDYHCGRVVRLLRILRDRGLFFRTSEVVKSVAIRLVDLYGTDVLTKRESNRAKASNILSLAEMKSLIDEAWGGQFLPPLEELRADIQKRGREKAMKNLDYLRMRGRTVPQPRVKL